LANFYITLEFRHINMGEIAEVTLADILRELKEIKTKLDEFEKMLSIFIEEELNEDELKELKDDLKAYKDGKLELIDLEELEKRYIQS